MADRIIPLDAWAKIQGSPAPLGASWIDSAKAWNFALYSTEATAVRLVFYGKSDFVNPLRSYDLDPQINKTIRVWHILVAASEVAGASLLCIQSWRPPRSFGGPTLRLRQGSA